MSPRKPKERKSRSRRAASEWPIEFTLTIRTMDSAELVSKLAELSDAAKRGDLSPCCVWGGTRTSGHYMTKVRGGAS